MPNAQARKGKGAAGGGKVYTQLAEPEGKIYLVEDSNLGKLQTLNTAPAPIGFAGLTTDDVLTNFSLTNKAKWKGWMTTIEEEEPQASVDWKQNSTTLSGLAMITPLSQDQNTILTMINDQPFYVDSRATVHISPHRSDFITLQPIILKDIKGVGGSAITAHSIGNIQLYTKQGNLLCLQNALYVPNLTVCLISVSWISIDNQACSTFDNEKVKIVHHSSGKTIAQGTLMQKKKLYAIDLSDAMAEHVYTAQ